MEFAGKDFIYLPKIKKDKIRKIRKAEEDNKGEAPVPLPNNSDKKKVSDAAGDSDDDQINVNSKEFDIDLVNPNQQVPYMNNMNMMNNNMGMMNNMNMMNNNMGMIYNMNMMNQQAAPGINFKKVVDTNVCVIKYNSLENSPENLHQKSYRCKKCKSYINKYSNLQKLPGENLYDWKCEFCSNLNHNLFIEQNNLPKNEIIDECIQFPQTKEETTKEQDDSSLILCFDISGSMRCSYRLDDELQKKFSKNNINRLDMVKLAMENILNALLKKSPKIKVGLVSFESKVEAMGDCFSKPITVEGIDLSNEEKIKEIGMSNTNMIEAPIKESFSKIINTLKNKKEEVCTALGPAVLLSLYLLNKAKIGSRIFVCTDGESNEGVGKINDNNVKHFYTRIGNIAKEKGIVISLITFKDSQSAIDILKNMVEPSGGDIFMVEPSNIFDEFNDFLENNALASEVEIKMNLNKCMSFRDEEKKDLINDESSIVKKLGNVTKEKETYFELKFKESIKLAEMYDINFDELKNLVFQVEIVYKKKDGGKYIKIITKNLKVSDNKDEINKIADMNIVSTLQIQKSAKLAAKGNLMEAQAQIHIARNYLGNNIGYNLNNQQIYTQFNSNMNSFHSLLSSSYQMNSMQNMNYNMGNMNNPMMQMNPMMLNMNYNMMNVNNRMMMNNPMMPNMNYNMMNMNMSNDIFAQQVYSLSNTSQNRQRTMYIQSNQSNQHK